MSEPSQVSRLRPPPRVIPRRDHPIIEKDISSSALNVLRRLSGAGFQAFLVGGCVRDLLLGVQPKDFDVVTDAHPEQIRSLFRRQGRLIGRRFRLVHVHFSSDIIEVSTFRAEHSDHASHESTEAGRIVRDNVYGDIDGDVWRRDFTVNALFYRHEDGSLLDYVGGMEDIQDRQLRLIGDPVRRFREDPVRMLRAVRFAGKLDFAIEPEAASLLPEMGQLLEEVPGSRLFEEFQKLFLHGCARVTLDVLLEYNLLQCLLPDAAGQAGDDGRAFALLCSLLDETDQRHAEGLDNSPAMLLAGLLWAPLEATLLALADGEQADDVTPNLMAQAGDTVLSRANAVMQVPRRFTDRVKGVWQLQVHMQDLRRSNVPLLARHAALRPAYCLMRHRYQSGETGLEPMLKHWEPYVQKAPEYKEKEPIRRGRRPRRRGRQRG